MRRAAPGVGGGGNARCDGGDDVTVAAAFAGNRAGGAWRLARDPPPPRAMIAGGRRAGRRTNVNASMAAQAGAAASDAAWLALRSAAKCPPPSLLLPLPMSLLYTPSVECPRGSPPSAAPRCRARARLRARGAGDAAGARTRRAGGEEHSRWALDYFVFSRSFWGPPAALPAFAIGRPAFDNWLVRRAVLLGKPTVFEHRLIE